MLGDLHLFVLTEKYTLMITKKMPKWPVLLLPEPTRKTEIESEGEKERE